LIGIQQAEVRMSTLSISYVLKVLLALGMPARCQDLIAPFWRTMLDPYRPELYYMRGPGPKWREKHPHDTAR
jgi:hypothetical protein